MGGSYADDLRTSCATIELESAAGIARLIQITDAHLGQNRGATLLGMDTDHSLQQVIDCVNRERADPDLLLVTGDISDDGYLSAYERMTSYGRQISDACFWLPGNHDDRNLMAQAVAGGEVRADTLANEIRLGNWQVLLLDTQIPGAVGGELGATQLQFLRAALEASSAAQLHTLVCLHHHPVSIGSAWLDEQMVADAAELFQTLEAFPNVKGVLWGHIHQQVDRERNGVKLMGSPSTCVQFAPGSEGFKADDSTPGYRWLDLHPDGRIETGVSRVQGVEFTIDLESKGYL